MYAAEDALPPFASVHPTILVSRVCADHGIPIPPLRAGERLRVSADGAVVPVSAAAALHAAAHMLTNPTLPPHGSEFASTWLDLTRQYAPDLADPLEREFSERGIHHTPEQRVDNVRRGAVYLSNNRPGRLVELVLVDPIERVVGSIGACTRDALTVGGRIFPMHRARYIYRYG